MAGGIPVARVACSSPADALCNRFGVLCSLLFQQKEENEDEQGKGICGNNVIGSLKNSGLDQNQQSRNRSSHLHFLIFVLLQTSSVAIIAKPDKIHLVAWNNQDTISLMSTLNNNQETRAATKSRRAFAVSRPPDDSIDHLISRHFA